MYTVWDRSDRIKERDRETEEREWKFKSKMGEFLLNDIKGASEL